jgi:hypothetical protein
MYVRRTFPPTFAVRTWLFLLRQDAKFTRLNVQRLRIQNLRSSSSVVASKGPVVSLTSYGKRVNTVYLAIESIAAGSILPSRIILWLDDVETLNNRPSSLKRLEKRGLEVRLCGKFGPHTKYYPYLLSEDNFDAPLVIADDDVLYSRWWLAGLQRADVQNPRVVSCYRAYIVRLAHGAVQPYHMWGPCQSTEPSFYHFATGVSGCIYPSELLPKLKLAGSEFLQFCPKGDDIWLHASALRAGFKIRQIRQRHLDFPLVPGTQSDGLSRQNVGLGYNDEQIRRTYTAEDIAILMKDQKPDSFAQKTSAHLRRTGSEAVQRVRT